LKWYDGRGENGITSKRIFEVEVFFSSQNIDFTFYLRRLLEIFFFFFFFSMIRLLKTWGGGGLAALLPFKPFFPPRLMTFEENITSSKTSFQME
jgi:hypothetical protein